MADSTVNSDANVEALTKQFKSNFSGWKEVAVSLHSVFVWKEAHHAPALGMGVTAAFFFLWLLNSSLLTTLSVIGILITVSDYVVPLLSSSLIDTSKWGPAEDKIFEQVCQELAISYYTVCTFWTQWKEIKETKPKLYSAILLSTLLMTAYIGRLINNMLLVYLVCLFLVLLPGLKHHGIIQHWMAAAAKFVQSKFGNLNKKSD